MVSQTLIMELKDIIRSEYGVDLPIEKVSAIGNGMVTYFDLLAKINYRKKSHEKV